jgi:hypothetical protein
MAAIPSIVLDGLLKPDGTLELIGRPGLPPGPVRVRLEAAPWVGCTVERWPDHPWLDENIPAPFDLRRPLGGERVQIRQVTERLPERHDLADDLSA